MDRNRKQVKIKGKIVVENGCQGMRNATMNSSVFPGALWSWGCVPFPDSLPEFLWAKQLESWLVSFSSTPNLEIPPRQRNFFE